MRCVCSERKAVVATRPRLVSGGRPDEAATALVVGHAGARPPAPADAQRAPGRDHAAQRPEVRPALPRAARRACARRPLQRAAKQTRRAQVRRARLHLRKIFALTKSRLVF